MRSSSVQIFHALLGGGRRLGRWWSEDFRGRREYGGDEVEAVKLFLTGNDEVAAALGFEKLELERGRVE